MDDETIDEYVQLGRDNAEVITLARNWCSHLEVEQAGGVGMLEEATGLPIGARMFACKYQRGNSIGSMQLRSVAVPFHDENCVGCPHRDPVRLPNLTQIVAARDRAREERARREAIEREAAQAALAEREQSRRGARDASLPQTASIIDLVAELDREYSPGTHSTLTKLAKTVPEQFTDAVQRTLVDLVNVGGEGRTAAALEVLRETTFLRDTLVELALTAMARHEAIDIAGVIVSDDLSIAHADDVPAALPAAFALAAPVREPFARDVAPQRAALDKMYTLFPAECEAVLRTFFRSESERARVVASGVWEVLQTLDPDSCGRLVDDAVASLELRDERLGEVDGARRATSRALAAALAHRPAEIDAHLQKSYAARIGREAILNAYADVCGSVEPRRAAAQASLDTRRLAFTRMLEALLDPSAGSVELRTIQSFLRDEAMKDESLLTEEAAPLLGSLALLLDRLADLKTSTSSLVLPAADPLSVLEKQSQYTLLRGVLNALSSLIGLALRANRERVLPLLTDVLGNDDTGPDLRSYVVRMLSGAAADRATIADLLPVIYNALTDKAQQVRAAGVALYGAIAKHGVDDLPPLLNDLVLGLLFDPYVVVHRGVVSVLRDIVLPEKYRTTAVSSLGHLVEVYALDRGDDRATREVIEAFARQHREQFTPETVTRLIQIAQAMNCDIGAETLWHLAGRLPDDLWLAASVPLAADPKLSEHDRVDLLRAIMRKNGKLLAEHAVPLRAAVLLRLSELPIPRTFGDDDFLDELAERLMNADHWSAARELLDGAAAFFGQAARTQGRQRNVVTKLRALEIEESSDPTKRVTGASSWPRDPEAETLDTTAAIRARFAGIAALGVLDAEGLAQAASEVSAAAESINDEAIRTEYVAFGHVLEAMSFLVRWKRSIRAAEVDADRYRKAAAAVAKELAVGHSRFVAGGVVERIASIADLDDVGSIASDALAIRLPLPLSKDLYPRRSEMVASVVSPTSSEEPSASVVAFSRFEFESAPVTDPQVVTPGLLHELTVDVSLSEWPAGLEEILLEPLSVVPRSSYEMPVFSLRRTAGGPPHHWRETAKFVIRDAQSLETGPLEFQYRALGEPAASNVDIVLEGQRSLHFFAYDPAMDPQTGYAGIDRKLLDIRTAVRRAHVPETDIAPFMRLMTALGSIAGRALSGSLFSGSDWPEKVFQQVMTDKLRSDRRIGSDLEEHPAVAGGTTDLSLQRVRLELKAEGSKTVAVSDARNYSEQESQYVAGSDRRLGIICILDYSEKSVAPGMPANDIDLLTISPPGGGAPLLLGVVVLRGNLRRPSDYSK